MADGTFDAFLAGADYLVTACVKCSLDITEHSGDLNKEEEW